MSVSMSANYSIIDLTQNTPAWIEWRHRGIGGSDASAIMGENRFKQRHDLLAEKKGLPRDFGQNEAMATGTALEPEARALFCQTAGMNFSPICLQHNTHEWLRASLDGMSVCRGRIVEIKCGKSVYRHAAETGLPPSYYMGQLQHALAITGLPAIDFYCYWPNCRPIHLTINRNDAYIARLLAEEEKFWKEVLVGS